MVISNRSPLEFMKILLRYGAQVVPSSLVIAQLHGPLSLYVHMEKAYILLPLLSVKSVPRLADHSLCHYGRLPNEIIRALADMLFG